MDERQAHGALALLERARTGDRDAFGALAEEHREALLRLCYKMTGSHEEAEDLVQETLLRAYQHIAEFELRSSVSTWLHRIATNACLDQQRDRKPWDVDKRFQWFQDNGELWQQMEQQMFMSPPASTASLCRCPPNSAPHSCSATRSVSRAMKRRRPSAPRSHR